MLEPTTSSAIAAIVEARVGRREVSAEQLAEHEGLVRWVVRQQRLGSLPFADALHEGRLGLWRALQSYDPTLGTRFSTYAVPAIARAVWRAVAADQVLVPMANTPQPFEPGELPDLIQQVYQAQVDAELRELVAELPARLGQVVVAHYGLATAAQAANAPQSFAAIGQALGVSRQRAQQLHVQALLWLAQPAHSLSLRRLLDRNHRRDYQQFASRQRRRGRTARGYRAALRLTK